MRRCRSSRRPRVSGPKETGQTPSAMSSRPTDAPAQVVETWTHGRCHRMPPWALTSRPSKRSGYSNGGGLWGRARGEGSSQAAGVRLSSAAGGRAWVNSSRQGLHFCCWCTKGGARRSGGVGVQRARPALVTTVLWRLTGCDALRPAAQAYPPRGPLGEPCQGVGGARHAVVGAETPRQSACLEHTHEYGCGFRDTRR